MTEESYPSITVGLSAEEKARAPLLEALRKAAKQFTECVIAADPNGLHDVRSLACFSTYLDVAGRSDAAAAIRSGIEAAEAERVAPDHIKGCGCGGCASISRDIDVGYRPPAQQEEQESAEGEIRYDVSMTTTNIFDPEICTIYEPGKQPRSMRLSELPAQVAPGTRVVKMTARHDASRPVSIGLYTEPAILAINEERCSRCENVYKMGVSADMIVQAEGAPPMCQPCLRAKLEQQVQMMALKRYALFAGDDCYPLGGFADYQGSFDALQPAMAHWPLKNGETNPYSKGVFGWRHIIDLQTGVCVFSDEPEPTDAKTMPEGWSVAEAELAPLAPTEDE
jgi:hypothetical protein